MCMCNIFHSTLNTKYQPQIKLVKKGGWTQKKVLKSVKNLPTMSLPPLRQPKHIQYKQLEHPKQKEVTKTPIDYVIVTLKSDSKLVVAADAYHGIIMVGGMFKCVVCDVSMENRNKKDLHKLSPQHKKKLMECPHLEDFSIHLMRQVNPDNYYCTICNVVVSKYITVRHISTEAHKEELNKAKNRAAFYKSVE